MYCNVLIFIHSNNISYQIANVGQKRPQTLHPYYQLLPAGDGGDVLLPAGDGGDELEAVGLLQQVLSHSSAKWAPHHSVEDSSMKLKKFRF